MVKQLQKKFIISAMLAVTILLVVLIGGINVFNYLTTSNDNDRLMEMLCYSFETSTKWNADTTDASGSQNNPDFPPQDNGTKPPDDKKNNSFGRHDKNAVDSARYAAVAIDKNGNIIRTDVTHISSLTEEEVEHLFRIINMLRDRGCGIIYISHKMEEILRISDDVTIMRDGKWIATKAASELTMDEIIKLMVGRELTNRYPEKDNKIGDVLLNVENLSGEYTNLNNVSFQARRGEILGVAGLDGSGRTELLEQIFGITTKKSGKITLDGKEVKNRNPHESIKNGFALLTEERRATGIFGILNIRENTTISSLKKYQTGPFLNKKKMKDTTDEYIKSLRVKTPNQETKISSLSGGNQQKVILARWLLTDPTVLLLDEPTRGIDVGAKYEIYQLILDLAKKGKTVIMVSSEMAELLGVCDKILVMSGGRLSGEVDAKTTNQEEIMTLAAKYV